ncbi:MAG: hypothetical protein GTO63_15935, partial [Anaerolineae bacterium]|nr:hypothetical protein [Anaerolineae bacterium]NIO00252.1 hypothetical protein [Anaerolineae bacterium]NIQ81372.1 hypothetical protein [Anaerolineae bacterium]
VALAALAVFFVVGFVLKITFRLLLLPLALLGGLLKVLGIVAVAVLGLVLAPVLFGLFLILAIPVLVLLGLFGLGWAVAAA